MKHFTSFSHRLMSLVFSVWCLVLVPTSIMAQDYYLKVGGIYVTEENYNNITGPAISSGQVWFLPSERVLVLHDAIINAINEDGIEMNNSYKRFMGDDLTIVLEGKNIINVAQDDNVQYNGILSWVTTNIIGDGTLLMNYPIRMYGADLNISGGCKVTAKVVCNDTYYGKGKTLTVSGEETEIYAPIYGFDNLVLNDGLKILVPEKGYYDSTQRTLTDKYGNDADVAYIAEKDWAASNSKLWVEGKQVGGEDGADINNIPIDKGTASYNPYSKTLTLNDAQILMTDYGITNYDPSSTPPFGDLLNIVVNGACEIWCTNEGIMFNGGLVTISGDGNLTVVSDDQSALKMFDRTIVNIYETNVTFQTVGGPAIKGEQWMKTEIVNVIHSSLQLYSPTYTTDQISGFNLLNCRFQDAGSLKGELFGFDKTKSGSITYDGEAHRGMAVIKPYDLYRYEIYIGADEVTSDNQDDPTGDGAFSYDPETSTLTMKKSTDRDLGFYCEHETTLRVKNNVSLTSGNGIWAYSGCPLTITGPGKLKLTEGGLASSEPLTLIDADVEVAEWVAGDEDNSKLNVIFSRLKANEISGFTGGITLAGCCISSPAGAQVKDGAIVDASGNVITTGVTIELSPVKKGDVNGDGAIDVADIAEIISVMAGSVVNSHADVNGDHAVDVADIAEVITVMASN